MGRLRNDYERPLFMGVSEEVVDLFGVDDVAFFRFSSADNISGRDPLYDEPTTTVQYKQYTIKCLVTEKTDDADPTEFGTEHSYGSSIYVALNHLIKAQVTPDLSGDYVSEGDVIGINVRGEYFEFDIINADRDGWINDSDKFVGYNLECKRRDKYVSQRKTGGP